MLYFQTKPNPAFQALLHDALELERQEISRISVEKDCDVWEAGYGAVSEHFSPYSALVTIEQLLLASSQETVYRLNDYHYLLIYECLKNYCALHDDLVQEPDLQHMTMPEYRRHAIDFQDTIDVYFWDIDCLFLSGTLPPHEFDLGLSCLHNNDSSYVTTDLRPHPRYLRLTPMTDPMWRVSEHNEHFYTHSYQDPNLR
ncbi:MAG: hypothetical protein NPIRA02_34450 [Nitrospirales bacterium]|nr:MAG: hypothetical protein NPIRA02_34450 [Nitrospirales bacterium]